MSFFNKFKKKKILVVSHDAGGANIIVKLIKKEKLNVDFFLKGPANTIIHKYFKKCNLVNNYSKKYDLFICGTSLNNNLERKAIEYSKNNKIKSISILDHWNNILLRFKYKKKFYFPDIIICGDKDSERLTKKAINKKAEIVFYKNPYFEYFENIKIQNKRKNNLVYMSSNFESLKKYSIKEKDIFHASIEKLSNFIKKKKINKIIIRPHPADSKNKFKSVNSITKNKIKIIVDNSKKLENILMENKYIVGHDTMGLVIAKKLKNYVINIDLKINKSIIPNKFINKNINI